MMEAGAAKALAVDETAFKRALAAPAQRWRLFFRFRSALAAPRPFPPPPGDPLRPRADVGALLTPCNHNSR